ncbi:DASS family sodium-coupled anion symporter [Sulfurospirillum deleyianum]|uniref:Anion transporter n=1 Tax=Sulfurospirillum deleyianum (strain ATCC 51133 / DSM 6946 / 5175) TaxID=525898 RepID=D1B2H5_SULD5|nr:DASS family sodium-coupled anion symporter [Sulfurospirillum deleyianum]ACZ12295.1 anion transporter [Sulfurospirillum deleyianum DSM 6946]
MSKKAISMLIPVLVTLVVWFIPAPEGLSANAWHFMAIFLGVVVGLVIEPVPAALVGLVGVCLVALLGIIDPKPAEGVKWALSGFSNSIIWLIFAAFMFAAGYQKTGLGKRISLIMVKFMGKSSLGLGYAVAFADLLLAPFMPSNTARSGGTIFPIAINIPQIFNSLPDNEPRKLGAYISWVAMAATCVTSSMFLTGLAPNLLAVNIIEKSAKVTIEWGAWASIMVPLMLPLFLLVPLLAYLIFPPTQKQSPEAPIWAAGELKKMGSISFKEIMMLFFAVLALVLWIFGKELGVNATMAAISIVSLMVLCNVISWDDIIGNKGAWNVLVWFATLVALASGLAKVGILKWIGTLAEASLSGLSPTALVVAMLIVFFILHYFFASVTAHVSALLPVFIVIAMKFVAPEQIPTFMILLSGTLGIMGIITPYGTGPSPIWYGAGYISQARWWALGAIFGAIFLAVLLVGAFVFM